MVDKAGAPTRVCVNVAFEAWSPGGHPGIGPMGNPLSSGVPDLQARSWGDYSHTQGVHHLLAVLAEHDVRASFFTSGRLVELAPDAVRAIAAAGHDIVAHGYHQDELPGSLDEAAERASVERCRDGLAALTGTAPTGWLSPRITPSPRTAALLVEAGFGWYADVFDADAPYIEATDTGPIVAVPFSMEVNDLPTVVRHGAPPRTLLPVLDDALSSVARWGGPGCHLDVTVHAHVLGRLPSVGVFDVLLQRLAAAQVQITTLAEVADLADAADQTAQDTRSTRGGPR